MIKIVNKDTMYVNIIEKCTVWLNLRQYRNSHNILLTCLLITRSLYVVGMGKTKEIPCTNKLHKLQCLKTNSFIEDNGAIKQSTALKIAEADCPIRISKICIACDPHQTSLSAKRQNLVSLERCEVSMLL